MPAQRVDEANELYIARLLVTIEERDRTIVEQGVRIHDLESRLSGPGAARKEFEALLTQLDRTGTGSVPWTSIATLIAQLDSSITGSDLQQLQDLSGLVHEDGTASIAAIIDWLYGERSAGFKEEGRPSGVGGHLHVTDVEARKDVSKRGLQDQIPACTSAQEQVFAWLRWSPQPGSPCWRSLHSCFPGALPGPAILNRSRDVLVAQGFTPSNTIYGQSICPDEINNQKGMLADSLKEFWGECFPLGGIGGPPFVGQTGWGAFTAHTPEDGNIVVLFGPHIGIAESGEVGKVHRHGQNHDSTACGAFVAAYNSCVQGEHICPDKHKHDMQQRYLKEQLKGRSQDIQKTREPMAALAVHAFEIVKEKLEAVINDQLPANGKLVLIGGVQINMPEGMQDHFFPLMFEMRSKGNPTMDLLPAFGCELTGKGSMEHS